jgi:hypothetical protein
MRCGQYMGDNDGTNPQLTCIRGKGHPGLCDNTLGDHQVWGQHRSDLTEVPVSFVYDRRNNAAIVLTQAKRQLPGMILRIESSELSGTIDYLRNRIDGTRFEALQHEQALELFRNLGWV